jgi:outer membrane protein TolC
MKHVLTAGLFMMFTVFAIAQNPGNSTYHSTDTTKVLDVRERLVQLAMQNPNYEVADRTVNKSLFELRKAKGDWLSSVSVSANVNEFTLDKNNPAANFYPRYNLGVNLPLNLFTEKNNNVKIARENYLIAEANRNEKYREIRAEVLTRYEDYLMYKERLESQVRITQDEQLLFKSKERDFEDGIINQEEYTRFAKAYEEAKLRKSEYERNFKVSKYDLERMIGIPLEEALATK